MTKDLTIAERQLIEDVLNFIKNMTIKNPSEAAKYETSESAKFADFYISKLEDPYNSNNIGNLKFSFSDFVYNEDDISQLEVNNSEIFKYDETKILNLGSLFPEIIFASSDEEFKKVLIKIYSKRNDLIPTIYREELLNMKITNFINDYEDSNNYYRTLNGLPPLETDSSEFIYVKIKQNGIEKTIPIHELTYDEFYQLPAGKYESILNENPNLRYIHYINPENKIDFYNARTAKDFTIIKYNKNLLEETYVKQILEIYYQIYTYTMNVVYSKAFKNQEYYDSFIIIYMIMATLQKFFSNNINNIIRREIYDIDSIRNMFYSYGLPFFEEIPLKYQRKILKNINSLLSYKGTDKVFIDLIDIFGFSDTNLYRYYLMKKDKTLKFAQIPIEGKDISNYIKNDFLYQDYEDIVGGDIYWGKNEDGTLDNDLFNEINEQEFNYISTKYLSVSTIFNMSKCAYEITYFFHMLNNLHKKELLKNMNFYNKDIKPNGDTVNIFNVVTALYILLYKRFNCTDFINPTPTNVMSVFGFNFDSDLDELKELVKKHSKIEVDNDQYLNFDFDKVIYDPTTKKFYNKLSHAEDLDLSLERNLNKINFLQIFSLPNTITKEALLNTYFKSRKFNEDLTDAMNNCEDIRTFKALDTIKKYNVYSDAITELYKNKGDFSTYSEYLNSFVGDKVLYDWVVRNSINKETIIKGIDTLLDSLEFYIGSKEFYSLFRETPITLDKIKEYLMKMIMIFKAYTVEIKKVNIYFLFNDKYFNTIRIFSYMKKKIKFEKADSIESILFDRIERTINRIFKEDNLLLLNDFLENLSRIFKDEKILFKYESNFSLNGINADSIPIFNYLESFDKNCLLKSTLEINDDFLIFSSNTNK